MSCSGRIAANNKQRPGEQQTEQCLSEIHMHAHDMSHQTINDGNQIVH